MRSSYYMNYQTINYQSMNSLYIPYLNNYDQPVILGEGAFGKVTMIQDMYGDMYALKTCTYVKYLSYSNKEAEDMKKLVGCPQLVQLMDTIPNEDGVDLVLELCTGSLLDLLYKSGLGLKQDVVLDMIRDVSTGLEFMRSKGMSHCDLKLENILYKLDDSSVSGYRFLICDFGNVDYGDNMPSFHRIQTNHYRSGENLLHSSDISSCDMASLACIIYEVITDKYLVDIDDDDELGQLEVQLRAIGFDVLLENDFDMCHPVNQMATQLYFDERIEQKGDIDYPDSDLKKSMMALGYTKGDEITKLIQWMLLPIPEKRLKAEQVKEHPLFCENVYDRVVTCVFLNSLYQCHGIACQSILV